MGKVLRDYRGNVALGLSPYSVNRLAVLRLTGLRPMLRHRLLWPPCATDADIIFSSCGFFFLSFCLFSSPISQPSLGCLPYFYTWCGLSANLGCRSETCCTRLAENAGPKTIAKNSPSGYHRTTYLRN